MFSSGLQSNFGPAVAAGCRLETATEVGFGHALCNSERRAKDTRSVCRRDCRQIDTYVIYLAESGSRKEVDRIDDRHGNDVFLGTEVKRQNAIDNLLRKVRGIHVGKLQLAQ